MYDVVIGKTPADFFLRFRLRFLEDDVVKLSN